MTPPVAPPPMSHEVANAIVWGLLYLRRARIAAEQNAAAMKEAAQ